MVKCEPDSDGDKRSETDENFHFNDNVSSDSDFEWKDTSENKNVVETKNEVKTKKEVEAKNVTKTKKVVNRKKTAQSKKITKNEKADRKIVAKTENGNETETVVATIIPQSTENISQDENQANNTEEPAANTTNGTEVDPNAPKKKRKYKKRAVKEKQTFECEICQYKCAHQCMYTQNVMMKFWNSHKNLLFRSFTTS